MAFRCPIRFAERRDYMSIRQRVHVHNLNVDAGNIMIYQRTRLHLPLYSPILST